MSPDRFELLCRDGRRAPISEYRQCNWGLVPSDAIVTSSGRTLVERTKYQQFLKRIIELYSDGIQDNSYTGQQQPQQKGYNNDYERNNFNNRQNNLYNNNLNRKVDINGNPIQNEYSGQLYNPSNRNGQLDSSFSTDRTYLDGTNESVLYEKFRIFESKRYGKMNLLFQVYHQI